MSLSTIAIDDEVFAADGDVGVGPCAASPRPN